MILTFAIARNSASASLCWTLRAEAFSRILAAARISSATRGLTRENSLVRKLFTLRALVSASIFMSMPSSTPCGCGWISSGSFGNSVAARS